MANKVRNFMNNRLSEDTGFKISIIDVLYWTVIVHLYFLSLSCPPLILYMLSICLVKMDNVDVPYVVSLLIIVKIW